MQLTQKQQSGFTIVELLIVIVVIGILAAITIVAYNGVQRRASTANIQSNLSNLGRAVMIYNADNGAFPASDASVKEVLQNAKQWDATHSMNTHTYLFCSNATAYAVISMNAPGVPAYSTGAGTTVYYWSSEKGVSTYISGSDNNWTPNCNLAIGSITWRQVSSSVN
jgi:prepilin-type N-terminal cleavage/methylation domain-containing protein